MSERSIKAAIRLAISEPGTVVFNNPVGEGWTGDAVSLRDGSVLIRHPRRVVFGLYPGSGDLIGWRSVVVTPEMVGQRVAVFVAIETKAPRGHRAEHQKNFIKQVRDAGGLAGFARSVDDAVKILGGE